MVGGALDDACRWRFDSSHRLDIYQFNFIMRTINSLVEQIYNERSLNKIFAQLGVPSQEVDDLCQDMYLSWLTNPDAILQADEEGHLGYYIIKACKNQACRCKERRAKFVHDEEYLNNLISE